jgi:hypothetical protein
MILDVWQRKGLRADFADVWQAKELEGEKEAEEGKEVEDVKEEKRADEAVRKLAGVRPFANGALYKSFEAQDKRSRLILRRAGERGKLDEGTKMYPCTSARRKRTLHRV